MKSYYYTKNPIDMIFTDKNEAEEFYSRINDIALNQLLEENNLYGITKENRNETNKLIEAQNNDYINREGKFTASNFVFYPDVFDENVNKDDMMTDIAYNPSSLSNIFATAYDDMTYNSHADNLPSFSERAKARDTLVQAVERGVNVEILKLHLAKTLNEQTADIKKNGKKSMFAITDIVRTENLLSHAEELSKDFSPYDKLFKMGEELATLKAKATKLEGEEWEKAQDKYTDMKIAFNNECAKFDPEMLQDVANHRKQYYVEVDKNMAMSKNTAFNLDQTIHTPAYQSTNIVGFYVKNALEKQERMRSENN